MSPYIYVSQVHRFRIPGDKHLYAKINQHCFQTNYVFPVKLLEIQEIGRRGTFIYTGRGGRSSEETHAERKSSGKLFMGRKSTIVYLES